MIPTPRGRAFTRYVVTVDVPRRDRAAAVERPLERIALATGGHLTRAEFPEGNGRPLRHVLVTPTTELGPR